MDILFVTPSLTPFHFDLGPAEGAAALGKALRSLGHRLTVAAPLPEEPEPSMTGLARRLDPLAFEIEGRAVHVFVHDGRSPAGLEWVLFEHEALHDLFEEGPRGLAAQTILARAVAALLTRDHSFQVLHAHGEEAALTAALVALERRLPTVQSLYSLSRPLVFGAADARAAGLDALHQAGRAFSPLLSAISCVHKVTTNAPSRLLRAEPGDVNSELKEALLARGSDLFTLLGGLDASVWNPLTDAHLVARYSPVDPLGKARSKAMLQKELGLDVDPDVALLGAIEGEVGTERIAKLAQELIRTDMQLVVQVLDEDVEVIDALIALSERMPHRLAVRIGDSQQRTHRVLAGADALILATDRPSLAMAAQRYGTVPVVRRDSLAAESVVDFDAKLETGTGILVDDRSVPALLAGARRAIAAFNRGRKFEILRPRLMRIDHSWERSARLAEHIYSGLLEVRAA